MSDPTKKPLNNILWQEEPPRPRTVIDELSERTEAPWTRAMAWQENGEMFVGVKILQPHMPLDMYKLKIFGPQPFWIHLIYSLFSASPIISVDVCRAIAYIINPSSFPEFQTQHAWFMEIIGVEVYERIAAEDPPDLFVIMDFLRGHEMQWGRDEITDAIQSGRIEYNPAFEAYGVEHPEARALRLAEEAQFLGPLIPRFSAFSQRFQSINQEWLKAQALQLRKKLTTHADLFAGVLLMCQSEVNKTKVWRTPIVLIVGIGGHFPDSLLTLFLQEQFPAETEDHAVRVARVRQLIA